MEALEPEVENRLDGGKIVRDGSFLAVAHTDEWMAIRLVGRVAAAATWAPERGLSDEDIFEMLLNNPRTSFPVVDGTPVDKSVPPLGDPPAEAVTTLETTSERAYQMHASIGPSAALAHLNGDILSIWTHSQGIYPLRESIAEALNRDINSVRLIHAPGAGCYGHNGADDAAFDAALVACALPETPILLKWTREDEHAWEPYGSAMVVKLRASIDESGRVVEWSHEAFSDTHVMRAVPGPNRFGPSRLIASRMRADPIPSPVPEPRMGGHAGIHRNQDPLYDFSSRRIVKHLVHDLPLRTSSLRGLGAVVNVMIIESMMDELAEAAGIDPVEFRLNHLSDQRGRAVLEAVAKRLPPGSPEDGIGRGLGFAQYKNVETYAAVAVELTVDDEAKVRLQRAVIAADAGEIVDCQGLISQFEGGLLQACSLTIIEGVSYDSFGINSRDWESYPILRFDNIPEIETVLIERHGERFLGAGEATVGPTAGAIANAIYYAVGLRLRRIPFTPDAIRAAAMS
jgi:CO/xanthine dehydrogenase Mo-binding subunit